MNELDYIRDNRLRLWFIEKRLPVGLEMDARNREAAYVELLQSVCTRLAAQVRSNGYVILVVGKLVVDEVDPEIRHILLKLCFNPMQCCADLLCMEYFRIGFPIFDVLDENTVVPRQRRY